MGGARIYRREMWGGVRIGGGGHTTFCEGMILGDFGWRQGSREEGVEARLLRIDDDGERKREDYSKRFVDG